MFDTLMLTAWCRKSHENVLTAVQALFLHEAPLLTSPASVQTFHSTSTIQPNKIRAVMLYYKTFDSGT